MPQLKERGMPPVKLDRYVIYPYTEEGQRRVDIVCRDCKEDKEQNEFYATVWAGNGMPMNYPLNSITRHEYSRHPVVPVTDAQVMANLPKAV